MSSRMTVSLLAWRCAGCRRHIRRRAQSRAETGHQPVLAAIAGAGTEADRPVLPGGIERGEVKRIRIWQREQRGDLLALRFDRSESRQRTEYGLVGRLALA